jgi:ribosome-associated heat shock protein Hsp15
MIAMPFIIKEDEGSIRIDKWLWAVRVFKTRTMASDACKAGKVKIVGQSVKPSREIRPGDEISVQMGIYIKTVKVTGLIHNRVGANLVPQFMDDLTPVAEYEKLKIQHEMKTEVRPRGIGRPTKKHRRLIDRLKNTKDFS